MRGRMKTTVPAPEQVTESEPEAAPISTKLARAALDLGIDFDTVLAYVRGTRAYMNGFRIDADLQE